MGPGRFELRVEAFAEIALPAFAGAAYALRHGAAAGTGEMPWSGAALILLLIAGLGSIARWVRDMSTAAILLGAAPVAAGCLAMDSGTGALRDPVLWCLAIPFAMWCGSVRLVASPRADSRNLYRIAGTLPMIALAVPVIQGQVHWGIVVLPFAVFRIGASTADKIRLGKEYATSLAEAREVTRRVQWVGGAWVAGWAGVTP
jgi:hypothetical protein